MLKYLRQLSFGLDIGPSAVSCLKVIQKGRRLALGGFSISPLASGLIRAGQIQDESYLAEIIKKTVAGARPRPIHDFFVNLALPEQSSFLQIVQLPKMNLSEVKEAVKWEIEANIPLPLEAVYYDWQILKTPFKKANDHFDILVAAAPKNIVESYISVVKRAGFFPKSVEIDSFSLARVLVPSASIAEPVLIVELMPNQATLVIFSGNAPHFSSSIPLSGRHFAEMAASEWDLVRKVKVQKIASASHQEKKESKKPPEEDSEANSEIKTEEKTVPIFANFLIEQIRSYLEFYDDHAEHEHQSEAVKVKKILLCGNGIFADFDRLLTKKLGIEAEIGNPFINVSKNLKADFASMSVETSLALAKVLGLAVKDFFLSHDKS